MTQQPTQAPLVAEALRLGKYVILEHRGMTVEEWIARSRTALLELARQLEQADTRIAVLEMGDMTATAQQWELAFRREKELREQAEHEKERLVETLELAKPWIGVTADHRGRWCPPEVKQEVKEALSEQHERSSDLGNSVARKNTKPSGEVGEEA